MLNSLQGRLIAVLCAVLLPVAAIQIALTVYSSQRYFQEVTQDVDRDVALQVAKRKSVLAGNAFDVGELKQLFSDLMTTHPSVEVYALDTTGHIVAYSAPPGAVVRNAVSLEPIRKFLAGARLPLPGDDPRTVSGRKVFSAAPVLFPNSEGASLAGYIYVVLEGQRYQSAVDRLGSSYILRQSVLATAAVFIVALLAATYLLRVMTQRLRRLAANMNDFEASGFTRPPDLTLHGRTPEEIDRLETTFATMAARMVEQMHQIRQTDAARREMLADVSHDLRTPLASLRGYLDTVLMKEEQLTPAEQREFLLIAARQSERLGTLIEDLLELARLDSPQLSLNREPASMAELVQDSLQKFAPAAAAKSVRLEGQLSPDVPPATIDVRLMARVIDNLIDNGLQHTKPGGLVTATVARQSASVRISVADDGCGIAPADLPHVLERFYRASASTPARHARPPGLGLGLAIAKQIVERHGAQLIAESEPGVGTRFSFVLSPESAGEPDTSTPT